MHKTPEITQLAKNLKAELAGKGLKVSHTQAMAIIANRFGARTLQVEQARIEAKKPKWGVSELNQFALREAGAWMFTSLGRYEDNVQGLIKALRDSFLPKNDRNIDRLHYELLEEGDHPVVNPDNCDYYRVEELPALFDRKVAEIKRLAAQLLNPAEAVPANSAEEVLFSGTVRDWERETGDEGLSPMQKRDFVADVKRNRSQFYVDISLPHSHPDEIEGTDQMSLFIEINDGLPCVHITNSIFGDQVLTIFATKDGLYLRPDSSNLYICTGTPRSESLVALQHQERYEGKMPHLTANHAFIESPNA